MKPKTAPKSEKPSRIPTFSSIEEEAEFWDTHSFEEFADELEEVEDFHIDAIRSREALTLLLGDEMLKALEAKAKDQGLNVAELVFRWIEEGLEAPASQRPP